MNSNSDLIIYQDGELELKVSLNNETVWLRQDEISNLFEKDRTVITRHIKNILKDKEVDEESNVQKMHFANSDKPVNLYSLDIILAVGYRTNSAKAIKFRQWSTNILRNYILNGYVINTDRITQQRLLNLEGDVKKLQKKVDDISEIVGSKDFIPKQGIFFDGQVFDAYKFVSDLFRSAKSSIVLIDNYIDDTVLVHLSKLKPGIKVLILTKIVTVQLKQDAEKFGRQYFPVEIKEFRRSHDRFIIIDGNEVYHFGASLKDLGKKWFAFSKIGKQSFRLISQLDMKAFI
ncbi:MAG TPA: RhuM family protein [Clostridiales bacterium]|nr:RhuM family protein [Clostridiales bacterium]